MTIVDALDQVLREKVDVDDIIGVEPTTRRPSSSTSVRFRPRLRRFTEFMPELPPLIDELVAFGMRLPENDGIGVDVVGDARRGGRLQLLAAHDRQGRGRLITPSRAMRVPVDRDLLEIASGAGLGSAASSASGDHRDSGRRNEHCHAAAKPSCAESLGTRQLNSSSSWAPRKNKYRKSRRLP